jgi:hypothetical protein
MDYVLEERGDTLVVKDDFDMGKANTLYGILQADSIDVPPGRVYLLHSGGYYSLRYVLRSSSTRRVIIAGEDSRPIQTNKSSVPPPIIRGEVCECASFLIGLTSGKDLTVKNCILELANDAGEEGWNFFEFAGPDMRLTVDNCLMEHTFWVMFYPARNCKTYIRNCYFVNMSGYPCRRNGGVMYLSASQDTLLVENCTHVMAQGNIYNLGDHPVKRMIFNHNNFINCAGSIFMNLGSQADASVTNNLFINSNIQGFTASINTDPGEVDRDSLPIGIVNVYPDSAFKANGAHFYVDNNLVYWDPIFDDYIPTLNTNKVNGVTNWQSQMFTMNQRSQEMFNDNKKYPSLTENDWIIRKMPNFKEPKNLFTTQLANIKTFALATVDTNSTVTLPVWRLVKEPYRYFTYPDWPIPVDLSYDDADLLTAAWGFPVGDLNWFPVQKALWSSQSNYEYAMIDNILYHYFDSVPAAAGQVKEFTLSQNYPNPFNPTTIINFSLPKDGFVTMKVFNSIGQEIVTLLDGFMKAQTYKIEFNGASLPSGVYVYQIQFGNNTISKKMTLIK